MLFSYYPLYPLHLFLLFISHFLPFFALFFSSKVQTPLPPSPLFFSYTLGPAPFSSIPLVMCLPPPSSIVFKISKTRSPLFPLSLRYFGLFLFFVRCPFSFGQPFFSQVVILFSPPQRPVLADKGRRFTDCAKITLLLPFHFRNSFFPHL